MYPGPVELAWGAKGRKLPTHLSTAIRAPLPSPPDHQEVGRRRTQRWRFCRRPPLGSYAYVHVWCFLAGSSTYNPLPIDLLSSSVKLAISILLERKNVSLTERTPRETGTTDPRQKDGSGPVQKGQISRRQDLQQRDQQQQQKHTTRLRLLPSREVNFVTRRRTDLSKALDIS